MKKKYEDEIGNLEFGTDIIVIAIEGGYIGYWARLLDYKYVDCFMCYAEIKDIDSEKTFIINSARAYNTALKIVNGKYEMRRDIYMTIVRAFHDLDACDIDGEMADVIIQIAMFDEILYS